MKDKGPTDSGKGYQGTCWRCGKVGHKASECARHVNVVEDSAEERFKDVDVGGVWTTC